MKAARPALILKVYTREITCCEFRFSFHPRSYGKPDSQARFWNGMSRPSVSACDAVIRDLEHYSFKVQVVRVNLCKHRVLCGGARSFMS